MSSTKLINEIFEPAGIVGVLAGHMSALCSAMFPYLSLAIWLVHKHSRESNSHQQATAKQQKAEEAHAAPKAKETDAPEEQTALTEEPEPEPETEPETEPKPEVAVAAAQAMREQFSPPFVTLARLVLLTAVGSVLAAMWSSAPIRNLHILCVCG